MNENAGQVTNRRQFLRMASVFPVAFRIVAPEGTDSRFDWFQGFTSNVSAGGLCLEVAGIRPEVLELLRDPAVRLALSIAIPVGGKPVPARAQPAWIETSPGTPLKAVIGLKYEAILPSHRDWIVRVARMKSYLTPVGIAVIVTFGVMAIVVGLFK